MNHLLHLLFGPLRVWLPEWVKVLGSRGAFTASIRVSAELGCGEAGGLTGLGPNQRPKFIEVGRSAKIDSQEGLTRGTQL